MSTVVTLAERHRRKLAAMRAALSLVDAALAGYARQHGGRFIRYGSSGTGRMRIDSDVDLIADFPDNRTSVDACGAADDICFEHGLVPDCRPAGWLRSEFLDRALRDGTVLA